MRTEDADWIDDVTDGLPEPPDGTPQLLVPLSTYRYTAALLGLATLIAEQLDLTPVQGLQAAADLLRHPATSPGVMADLQRGMDRIAEADEEDDDE